MKKNKITVTILLLLVAVFALIPLGGCSKTNAVDLSTAKNLEDFRGVNIAAQSGTFHYDALMQIDGVVPSEYEDFQKLFIALKAKAIDGYIAEEPTALSVCALNSGFGYVHLKNNDTGFTTTPEDVSVAIGVKKGSVLLDKINSVLENITTEQKETLMSEIVDINSGKAVESLSLSNAEPQRYDGVLKVAMECAYAPYNWKQNTDADFAYPIANGAAGFYANGYDVQIAKYVANALNLKLEIYESVWESLVPGVQSEQYDAIIAGMSPTAERREEVDFSVAYYESNLVIIYNNGVADNGNFFVNVGNIIATYWTKILSGVGITLLISLTGTAAGLIIGLLIGIIRTMPESKNKHLRRLQKIINWIFSAYIEVFRGTPMMVQAMVIYWGYAFASGGAKLPLLLSGIVIVSINTGAYMAEIVRGGIISIDKGQYEGASSIGMNHWQIMLHVILPQVFRNILPSVSNEFIVNIKDTSVLNVIGVTELYYFATMIMKMNFKIFETYFVVCVIYFILTFTISRILRLIERKLDGNKNYVICGSQSDPQAEIRVK